ncbi:MAG: glycosyltransferase family 4 protein [Planctomycetota bacterium]
MLTALSPHAAGFATWHPKASSLSDVRVLPINSACSKILSAVRLPYLSRLFGRASLRAAIHDPSVSAICCHYVNLATSLASVWKGSEKPLLVHAHGYDVTWDYRLPRRPHVRIFSGKYVERVRKLSERAYFLANSQCTAERLRAIGIPAERIVIKYLGVPVPDHPVTRPENRAIQILFLGRLVNFKGPEQTLRAFELACRDGLQAKLVMAGDGPLRASCEKIRRESPFADRIQILGSVDAMKGEQLRRQSSIFTAHNQKCCVTNQEEAYGVSVVEAMASGLPVITGRNGGVCETVVHGETGLLFQPGDVAAHARGLLELAAKPNRCERLGDAGFRRAKKVFSIEAERATWSEILDRIGVASEASS